MSKSTNTRITVDDDMRDVLKAPSIERNEMPSKSKKQAHFMAAAAHDPEFAKKAGISQGVAKEFNQADKRKRVIDKMARRRGKQLRRR